MIRGWCAWVLLLAAGLSAGVCPAQDERSFPLLQLTAAQNDPAADRTPSNEQTISGQVVDSVTGQPIARALVEAGGMTHGTLSDHEGHFVLEHAAVAFAHKPGYFENASQNIAADGKWLLKLTPEAILYGTITDADARPIQRMQVELRRVEVRSGLAYWQDRNVTVTNAEGEFRFAELPAGEYSLATGFMIDGLPDAASSQGFVPVTYPQAAAGSDAGTGPDGQPGIPLNPGEHVQANLSPSQEKLFPVSGAIRGAYNGIGAGFTVTTLDNLPLDPPVRFFPDGVFRLRLPQGTYRLTANSTVNDQQQSSGTREITVGPSGLQAVTLDLAALPSIPVEVEYEHSNTSQPSADPGFANLTLASQDPGNRFEMIPAQPLGHERGPYTPHAGDPMVFHNVRPGHYLLQVNLQPPWYVAAASCGNLDMLHEPLVTGEGTGVCSLRVGLRDDSASLHWTVPYQGPSLVVMAFPLDNLTQDAINGNSTIGTNGSSMSGTITGLAPGRYLVIASTHHLELAYRDQQALEKYLGWGKEVTLAANDVNEIELTMAPEEP
jgi:hypothetical protein